MIKLLLLINLEAEYYNLVSEDRNWLIDVVYIYGKINSIPKVVPIFIFLDDSETILNV